MAKVTRDTGRQSAMDYLTGFGKDQRFKITAGEEGCSITAEAGKGKDDADKAAAAKAIAKLFDSAPADGVFGVTCDKVGLSVGIIPVLRSSSVTEGGKAAGAACGRSGRTGAASSPANSPAGSQTDDSSPAADKDK